MSSTNTTTSLTSTTSTSTSTSSLTTTTTTSASTSTTSTILGLPTTSSSTTSSLTIPTDTSTSSTTESASISTTSSSTTTTASTASTIPIVISTSTSTRAETPPTTAPTVTEVTTSIVSASPTLSPPARTAAPSTSKGFFANKGAVAGVFTVVGLVAVALVVVFIITAIRRRRAKEFDREVEAAAAEAAAASAPAFLDDDDDPYQHHGNHANTYADPVGQYSDVSSHGTYSQPPLGTQEAYSMRERGPAPGELYVNPYVASGVAGAAGVGVARARSTRDPGAFASGFQEGSTPYPAFAGPAAFHSGAYGNHGNGNNGGGFDAVDATGVGAGMTRGMSLNHQPSTDYAAHDQGLHPGQYIQQSDLARNPSQATYNTTSQGSSTLAGSAASPPLPKEQPSFAAHYANVPAEDQFETAYAGYTELQQGPKHEREDTPSYYGEEEDEGRPRVLKVANE